LVETPVTVLPVVADGVFVPVVAVVVLPVPSSEACTMSAERSVAVVFVVVEVSEVVPASLVDLLVGVVVVVPGVFAVAPAFAPERRLVAWAIRVERSVVGASFVGVLVDLGSLVVPEAGLAAPLAASACCWRFEASTVAWTIIAERSDPAATGVGIDFAGAGVDGAAGAAGVVGVLEVESESSEAESDESVSEFCFEFDWVELFCCGVGALFVWDCEGCCCCCCCCITSLKLEESSLDGALLWDWLGIGRELIAEELADEIMLVGGCG